MSDNLIDVLPTKFSDLKWLRIARLARNNIVDMRPFVGLTGCEELDLSQNEVTQIPDTVPNMTSLVTLDLSYNRLVSLPPAICSVSFCFGVIRISLASPFNRKHLYVYNV